MKFDDEFKKAISNLPPKEKDKLILRYLRKDHILANRLYFELVSGDSVQGRRTIMENHIRKEIARATKHYHSAGWLLSDLRSLSGEITEHVKITKDKFGEASLNLLMLNEALSKNSASLNKSLPSKSYKFYIYIIARAFKILILIKALHEDYHIEFEDGLKELSDNFGDNNNLMKLAINNGFDPNWLFHASIPDDIVAIHKDVKDRGFLK